MIGLYKLHNLLDWSIITTKLIWLVYLNFINYISWPTLWM